MKIITMFVLTLAIAGSVYAGKPGGGGCGDVPLTMKFVDTTSAPEAIWNDDPNVAYQNGVDGVEAVIHVFDGCAGTRDATLLLGNGSSRGVWFQFPTALPGSIIQGNPPLFAGGAPFMDKIFMNIRNLTARGSGVPIPGPAATFYTRVAFQLTGPDGVNYRLGFMPEDSTCPGDFPCAPNIHGSPFPDSIGDPEDTAWVKVTYTPSPDRFVVEGEFVWPSQTVIQRGGLFIDGSWVHVGQYSLPFKILINALAPLPAFQPSVSISDVSVTEGNTGTQNVTFTVKLDATSTNSVSVKYGTSNGTAKSPSDYAAKTGTVTIPAGNTTGAFTISVKGDTTVEANETFNVSLSNPINTTIGDGQAICTIVNDD